MYVQSLVMAAMDVADSLSPSGGMQYEDKEVLPTGIIYIDLCRLEKLYISFVDVETPSSLIVSSETACGLKQSES